MELAAADDDIEGHAREVTVLRRSKASAAPVFRRRQWLALFALLITGCAEDRYQQLNGSTMGTGYRITARCEATLSQASIDAELQAVNAEMSTWIDDSALSQFNRAAPGDWLLFKGSRGARTRTCSCRR